MTDPQQLFLQQLFLQQLFPQQLFLQQFFLQQLFLQQLQDLLAAALAMTIIDVIDFFSHSFQCLFHLRSASVNTSFTQHLTRFTVRDFICVTNLQRNFFLNTVQPEIPSFCSCSSFLSCLFPNVHRGAYLSLCWYLNFFTIQSQHALKDIPFRTSLKDIRTSLFGVQSHHGRQDRPKTFPKTAKHINALYTVRVFTKQSLRGQVDIYRQHSKHALADVECMSPVMVENHPVVFSDSQQPSAQCLEGKLSRERERETEREREREREEHESAVLMMIHGSTQGEPDHILKEKRTEQVGGLTS